MVIVPSHLRPLMALLTRLNQRLLLTTISVSNSDDDKPTFSGFGSGVSYTESATAVTLESNLAVADTDDTNLEGATVRISTAFVAGGEDVLAATTSGTSISASYSDTTGILTLSGSDTLANYQAVLRTVTYDNTNDNNPSDTNRVVSWQLYDGANYSTVSTTAVAFTATNDVPTIGSVGQTVTYTEQTPAAIDADLTVGDVDSSLLKSATVKITNVKTGDELQFTDTTKITGSTATSGNVLTLSLTGNATAAEYQEALRSVKFNNTTDTPDATARTINWNVVDSADGTLSSPGTSTINITAVNDAPTLGSGGNVVQFTEGDSAAVVNGSITLGDPESVVVDKVTAVLAGAGSNEQLNFSATSKITGSWSAATGGGTLTLTKVTGQTPTLAEYQSALQAITYTNTNTLTTDGNRTVTFKAFDGTTNTIESATVVTTISVASVENDKPAFSGFGSGVSYTESATAVTLEEQSCSW